MKPAVGLLLIVQKPYELQLIGNIVAGSPRECTLNIGDRISKIAGRRANIASLSRLVNETTPIEVTVLRWRAWCVRVNLIRVLCNGQPGDQGHKTTRDSHGHRSSRAQAKMPGACATI